MVEWEVQGRCQQRQRHSQSCPREAGTISLVDLGGDEVSSLLHGGDLLRAFLVQLDVEFLLQGHHDLHGVEGVGTQVDELGVGGDLQQEKWVRKA